jgi:hypothetical protein
MLRDKEVETAHELRTQNLYEQGRRTHHNH